ncbi:MAG: M56 family metallopeptidase [Sphingomonas sp.]|uniref:M56 family metallopeptidase n=1 Tax=Sphingomonas sp. TaxID=28214 RepID=UPI002275EB09|nr:M56 family metallopeptidase [Sphingomonas sp.]MCX8474800.1 M56 family metallopeptidase [Sphingomonas sp.]
MAILLLALKSLLVAAATLLLLRLTRRRSAAERSTIAHLGLFALVALPLASLALPSLSLPVPESIARMVGMDATPPPATATPATADVAQSNAAALPLPAAEPRIQAMSDQPSAFGNVVGALARHAYLLPTAALLLLTLAALLRLVGLRARAEVLVEPEWLAALARAQRRMGFKSGTALLRSEELASPISWGLMRPTILLSDAAARAPEQAEAIIAHELAHVVQLDWAKLMLARVATAAFWFNPLAWVLAREAHQLREEAADDAVLAADIDGPDYAELLIGVARHECRGVLLGAHGVAPGKNSLHRRIARVLDLNPARRPSGRSWVAGFAAGMLTMAAPLAALTLAPSQAASVAAGPVRAASAAPASPASRASSATSLTHGVSARAQDTDALPSTSTNDQALVEASSASQVSMQAVQLAVPVVVAQASPSQEIRVDQIIEMRAIGITPEYKRAMAQAGFPGLTTDQLAQARSLGVTPEYVRDMRAAGLAGNFEQILGARALRLDPGYVGEMRRLGVRGSLDDYQGMIALGVTPQYVRRLRARGIGVTSPDKLTELKAVGFDPDKDSDGP